MNRLILTAARTVADILGVSVEATHVGAPDPALTGDAADYGMRIAFVDREPLEALRSAVGDPEVALAVLGGRRETRDPRPAGHVAEALLTHAAKPLLVVGPQCSAHDLERFERVLVPQDGSGEAAAAVREVVDLFGRRGLDVVALHVFTERTVPNFFDQPQHGYPEFADRLLGRLLLPPSTRLTLGRGAADRAVLAAIDDEAADLVVLGWSQQLLPGRANVIRRLLVDSRIPILLLPTETAVAPAVSTSDRPEGLGDVVR